MRQAWMDFHPWPCQLPLGQRTWPRQNLKCDISMQKTVGLYQDVEMKWIFIIFNCHLQSFSKSSLLPIFPSMAWKWPSWHWDSRDEIFSSLVRRLASSDLAKWRSSALVWNLQSNFPQLFVCEERIQAFQASKLIICWFSWNHQVDTKKSRVKSCSPLPWPACPRIDKPPGQHRFLAFAHCYRAIYMILGFSGFSPRDSPRFQESGPILGFSGFSGY